MQVIKDAFDAFSERVRSPWIGSILFAFLFWNWKDLWILFFADLPAADRLVLFEATTDASSLYLWPIVTGIVAAMVLPWITYVGEVIARAPNRAIKKLQTDEARQRRIDNLKASIEEEEEKSAVRVAQMKMQENEERAKVALDTVRRQAEADARVAEEKAQAEKEEAALAAARRLEEASEISEEAEQELREQRLAASDEKSFNGEANFLDLVGVVGENPIALELMRSAVGSSDGQIRIEGNHIYLSANDNTAGRNTVGQGHRDALRLAETASDLANQGLLKFRGKGHFEVTTLGYSSWDRIEKTHAEYDQPHLSGPI